MRAAPADSLLDPEVARSMEDLRWAEAATEVCLLRITEGWCSAGALTPLPGSIQVSVRVLPEGCHAATRVQCQPVLATTSPGRAAHSFVCLSTRLGSGGTLALRLGFAQSDMVADSDLTIRRAGLAVPLLMWAKQAWESGQMAERLVTTEEVSRAHLRAAFELQEEEREWLALELHDTVAQTMVTVFQHLQTLESMARADPEMRQVAVRGSVLCRQAIREARNIMNDLHPPVLEEQGLVPLLQDELRLLKEEAGCVVEAELSAEVRPSRPVELALYRILHEALVNIRRHAAASEVRVQLNCDGDGVVCLVVDNGVGFDVAAALAEKRVGGLLSMQRRAQLIGGTCQVESSLGRGTTVRIEVPDSLRWNRGTGFPTS